MNRRITDALITIGWSLLISSVVLNALYQRMQEPLSIPEVIFIFLACVLAGMLLVDAEVVVLSYVGMLVLSTAIIYFSLTLPALLSVIKYAPLRTILMEGAIGIVTRIALIYLVVPCLMGVILGGILGERLRIR